MSEQEGPSTAEEPSTVEEPSTTEVPSATPVPGWVQGVDGKWWPPAPPRNRPARTAPTARPKPKRGRRVVGGVGFAVFVVAVLAIVAAIVAVLVNYGDDSGSSTAAAKGSHAVGETARTASVDATLTNAQNPYAEPNAGAPQPGPGYHFVAVQLTMTNVSTKDLVVAPEQLFQLIDADGQKEQLVPSTSVPTLEGVLVALGTRTGGAVFTVPNTARGPFTFRVKGEPSAGGVTYTVP